ncbi:MAG: YgcG family protein [Lentimicrobium sp.]
MKRILKPVIIIAFITILTIVRAAEIPFLTGRVNDNAGILSENTIRLLSEKLKQHEDSATNQVVVLTVQTLNGENIEDFSNAVFNSWKLGKADKNNGVLMVIVPNERKMRIEVGYGLESVLTDLMASRIIRNIMSPRFKENDYDGGVMAGADAVISVLNGDGLIEIGDMEETSESFADSGLSGFDDNDMPLTTRILIGAFIFGILGLFTVMGVISPGVGWFMYLFLIPFWAMFPMIVVGTHGALALLIIYMVGYPVAKLTLGKTTWYQKAQQDLKSKGKASIGGFTFSSGGPGGSWSSGSSSSGSSFSGGGGSSGGGGASGGW